MPPRWAWLGRVPFAATATLQERLREDVIAGRAPETLLLLEHDPVITLGRSARVAHILAAPEELQRQGIAVHPVSRGGDVTYHGPGQLVGYPIVRLRGGVVGHMRAMADGLVAVLAGQEIAARWDRQAPGLWVDASVIDAGVPARPAKLCAFGVHVRQRVTMHGFALNVTTGLDAFSLIVPCGLAGVSVTSMNQLRGQTPSLPSLATLVAEAFARSFALPFERVSPQALVSASAIASTSAPLASNDDADRAFVIS